MARLEIFVGVLLAICLSVSARSTASTTVMNLHLYSNATARSAVCNDGTPSGFYFRTGGTAQGTNSSKYVIHLQGGAWCFDQASCQSRWQSSLNLMSSSPWPSTFDISSGIFAPDPHRNPFYDWNAAYVQYCSSDTWSGNSSATFAGKQWQFQGHNILIALIEDLWNIYGLSSATEIVFSGCSAGGQGVIVNLDFFASYLQKKGSTAKVKGLADAGWLQNLVPWSGDIYTTPIQDQMQKGIQLWGGIVHQGCAYSNNYGWQWLCYLSPFAYPHIRTPVFIQSEQYDTYQVTSNCCNPPFDSQESAYVATVRESFAASMYTVQPPNGVFSAACFHHCSSEDNTFYSITVDKVSMADAVGFWYQDSKNTPVKIIDSCRGFNCSSGCPSAPY